jgi:hypothetical protein
LTTTLSVVLVAIVTEIELILFSEPRIVGIHFVDEVVLVPAQPHECNSCAWMFRQAAFELGLLSRRGGASSVFGSSRHLMQCDDMSEGGGRPEIDDTRSNRRA